MKNIICLFVLILVLANKSYSQNLTFNIGIGYGTYIMTDLKQLQRNIVKSSEIDIPFKIVDQFPGNIFPEIQAIYPISHSNKIGLSFAYHSTGGRIHYADYSGEYKNDFVVKSPIFSFLFEKTFSENYKINLIIKGSYIINSLLISEKLQIADEVAKESYEFSSKSLGIEVDINWELDIYDIQTLIYIGGMLNTKSELTLSSNENAYLLSGEKKIGPTWTGIRFGLLFKIDMSQEK